MTKISPSRPPRRTHKLNYSNDRPRSRIPQIVLDWFGEDYAFDSFGKSFRTAALYWVGFLTLALAWLAISDGRFGRSNARFEDRLEGALFTAIWTYPLVIGGCALYAYIGTRHSQRVANIVAIGMVLAGAAIPVAYIWWTLR